jgi:hypothetical protein
MSKLFGLDWQEYPAQRMNSLMAIDSLIQKIQADKAKQANLKR